MYEIRFLDYIYHLIISKAIALALQKRKENSTLSVIIYNAISRCIKDTVMVKDSITTSLEIVIIWTKYAIKMYYQEIVIITLEATKIKSLSARLLITAWVTEGLNRAIKADCRLKRVDSSIHRSIRNDFAYHHGISNSLHIDVNLCKLQWWNSNCYGTKLTPDWIRWCNSSRLSKK